MPVSGSLPEILDDAAGAFEAADTGQGWGEVLAVVVIQTNGVRVMSYAHQLAAAPPGLVTERLAELTELLGDARQAGLN